MIYMDKPLAIKMAPKSLKDVIGQKHLIGTNKILKTSHHFLNIAKEINFLASELLRNV